MNRFIRAIIGNFARGVLALLPFLVTIYLFILFFRLLEGVVAHLLVPFPTDIRSAPSVRILSGFLLIVLVTALGYAVKTMAGRWAMKSIDGLINRLPVVRSLYKTVRQVADMFSMKDRMNTLKPVLVEWPSDGLWAVAFLTGTIKIEADSDHLTVFMPTSPNPTSGFLVMLKKEKIKPLNLTVEAALKLVLTAGVVKPHFKE